MFRKCLILINTTFLFFLLSGASYSKENNCYSNLDNSRAQKIFSSIPENITVEIKQSRNWYSNIFEILVEREKKENQFANNSVLKKKNKRRFIATVKAYYKNNIVCSHKSRVRLSGDLKDHIQIIDGNFFTSLDVKLDEGNINGIVDFKLLIPETRKDPNYEILFTKLLSEIDILAPRTFLLDVKVNNLEKKMLFQEKIRKEMLEFNKRVEGPLLEGSERYMFTFLRINNPFFNAGIDNQVARITNSNWAKKSENHFQISDKALTELNKVYLKWIDEMIWNPVNISHYNLNENILSNNNNIGSEKLGVFSSLMYAAGARHGMSPHNRKFHWNSLGEYFEPVYYDGDIVIEQAVNQMKMFNDKSYEFTIIKLKNVKKAQRKIENLEIDILYSKFLEFGGNLTRNEMELFFKKLSSNLIVLQEYVSNKKFAPEDIQNTLLNNYFDGLRKTKTKNKNLKVVYNSLGENYSLCNIQDNKCEKIDLQRDEILKLISDELVKDDTIYQYIGIKENLGKENQDNNYRKLKIKNTDFYYDENIIIEYNEDQNNLDIYQKSPFARAYFINGGLNKININFIGLETNDSDKLQLSSINNFGLTGCLSFINIKFENVKIKGSKGACEDTINLVNSTGEIKEIEITEAFSDALDLDFSKLNINNVFINKSKNDCADFSFGNYNIDQLNLSNCGDKALSVGERSVLTASEINIKDSKMGIASKDGSIVKVIKNNSQNLEVCLAAYNKKQEFFGGFIKVDNFLCKNSESNLELDQFSQIKTLNTNIK